MRAYLTGGSGFVGYWLLRHLSDAGDTAAAPGPEVDVTDPALITADLAAVVPDVVFHLAALTHVGQSWHEPAETFRVNAMGTLNLLEAAAACEVPPVVVLVSSAEVYGPAPGAAVLDEHAELRPVTPYAVSKVAAEFLGLQAFLGRGLRVIRARPFNHVGPGQTDDFVVSALARRMVEAELNKGGTVQVGNLAASRDFTDVRDVVRAYRPTTCAQAGRSASPRSRTKWPGSCPTRSDLSRILTSSAQSRSPCWPGTPPSSRLPRVGTPPSHWLRRCRTLSTIGASASPDSSGEPEDARAELVACLARLPDDGLRGLGKLLPHRLEG